MRCKRTKADAENDEFDKASVDLLHEAKEPLTNVELETGGRIYVNRMLAGYWSRADTCMIQGEVLCYVYFCSHSIMWSWTIWCFKGKSGFRNQVGTDWIDIETLFLSSIAQSMDMIIVLRNNLSAVDLTYREQTLFVIFLSFKFIKSKNA
jgi:hypothetical protein